MANNIDPDVAYREDDEEPDPVGLNRTRPGQPVGVTEPDEVARKYQGPESYETARDQWIAQYVARNEGRRRRAMGSSAGDKAVLSDAVAKAKQAWDNMSPDQRAIEEANFARSRQEKQVTRDVDEAARKYDEALAALRNPSHQGSRLDALREVQRREMSPGGTSNQRATAFAAELGAIDQAKRQQIATSPKVAAAREAVQREAAAAAPKSLADRTRELADATGAPVTITEAGAPRAQGDFDPTPRMVPTATAQPTEWAGPNVSVGQVNADTLGRGMVSSGTGTPVPIAEETARIAAPFQAAGQRANANAIANAESQARFSGVPTPELQRMADSYAGPGIVPRPATSDAAPGLVGAPNGRNQPAPQSGQPIANLMPWGKSPAARPTYAGPSTLTRAGGSSSNVGRAGSFRKPFTKPAK